MPPTPIRKREAKTSPTTTRAVSGWPVGQTHDAQQKDQFMESSDRLNVTGNRHNMGWLCRQFPTLRYAQGADPFLPHLLDEWVRSGAATSASRHAVRFVLQVWNSKERWKAGPFNVVDAFAVWDDLHRAAFLRWATDPWFP